jgi:holin-like protein
MLKGMAILVAFQLIGEVLAASFHLPISGPIIGMALLLVWLQSNGGMDNSLSSTADTLLANMAILFVPIGVGAMVYAEVLQRYWLLVAMAVVFGTAATIATTALTARLLTKIRAGGRSTKNLMGGYQRQE